MYEPKDERNDENLDIDMSTVSDEVAEHVERQLEELDYKELYGDEPSAYSDAGYILSEEAPTTPRRYYTIPPKEEKPPKEPKAEPRQRRSGGRIFAGFFACLLIGCVIGFGVAGIIEAESPDASLETPPIETSEPSPTPLLSINNSPKEKEPSNASSIYNHATSEVVGIRTEIVGYNIFGQQTTNAVSGTGFIVSEDGYIITNYHVIEDARKRDAEVNVILYSGESYTATIVGYEANDSDIAVLKIDATGLNPVTLGDSGEIQVGEPVYAVGNPLGELTYTMTDGMISALDREISNTDAYTGETKTVNMFQISAAVNSGNSGGPVYNERGEVVGVVTAKYSSSGVEGLGFAIPINDAVSIANDIIENGYVSGKPWLGVNVQSMPQNVANYYNVPAGSLVVFLEPGKCSELAGVRVGDIITGVDEYEVRGNSELKAALKNYKGGDAILLTVFRNGEYTSITVTLDEAVPEEDSVNEQTQSVIRYPGNYNNSMSMDF